MLAVVCYAVALNVADVSNRAVGGAGSRIEARGLAVQAATGGEDATPEMGFAAKATSGAGSDKVGVAGSLAINLVDVDSEASVAGWIPLSRVLSGRVAWS